MNISEWSISHPYAIISFYLGVVVLALLAIFYTLPRRMMPYVQSPLIGVVTTMPGLSAQEMEMYISKPIEEQLVSVRNLRYIRSTSQDGFSIVSLEFSYGTDMKKALFDVQALMNIIQANLPVTGANLKPSWVLPIDPLNIPILSVALTGEGWDPVRLREFADNTVSNILKTEENVFSVVPFGGYRRQVQVIVDRDRLASRNLSLLDVRKAIDSFNVSRSAGSITQGTREAIVRVDNRALSARDIMNFPIASMSLSPGGREQDSSPQDKDFPRIVYVKDVAQVLDTYWERRSAYHYVHDGKTEPAIEVSIIQNPEASSARIVPQLMKRLRQLEKENPGIRFQVAYDNSHFVNILFRNMFEELLVAVLLTGLVVLLFLGEWRGALISLLTIPTSLAIAILCLLPMGMTLNSGTLIGLLISIGRLVDDSIIDIHAVERHLRMGKDPRTATIDGITEVRLAVLSSTSVLILALVPLLFCGGIVQAMFVELVWPLIFALLASTLVSFTLTALLASKLLRPEEEREGEKKSLPYRLILNPIQNLLERMEKGYGRVIAWMLRHRFSNLARILATVIIGFAFYYFIGSEMMPLADVGQAYGILEMQPGTSFKGTEEATGRVEEIMKKHPEIKSVSTEIGVETMFESFSPFFTGYSMPAVNSASFMITLSDKDERKKTIWDIMDSVQKEATATIPGIRRLQIKEMGSDVMATSSAPIQILVFGKDLAYLDRLGAQVTGIAAKTRGIFQVASSWSLSKPEYRIKVDPVRAAEAGLSPEAVSQQVYYATRGGLTDEFYRLPNIRQNTILIRYREGDRRTSEDLGNIQLVAPDGKSVPLKSLASIESLSAPSLIEHDGLRRVVTIMGYYRIGYPTSMDLSMNIVMDAIAKVNFPPGYGIEMRGDMTQMMDSFRRLLFGLLLALIFIFLILVAQFRGFLQPLQMIFSIPLELSGVFIALWLAHQSFSTVSIMAVIVLTGMDITTAILLIDMIMKNRDHGMERNRAIIEACPTRLRPILMTSLITIAVMIPVSLFPKTGMDAYSPLGTVIIGGLAMGTILSLFDIPIMHTYVDDLIAWIHRVFLKKPWIWPVREDEAEVKEP
ncbi:MAG: efflux RND transporter permease subunit [Candidatus Eremiobacteraeota bacterium]|nr:efflux RND transporter permease subunit [Candidatus Eremiobacteraeota bacterium]